MHARHSSRGYTQVFTFSLLLGCINNTFFSLHLNLGTSEPGWWNSQFGRSMIYNGLSFFPEPTTYEEKPMCEFTQRLLNRPTSVCFSLIARGSEIKIISFWSLGKKKSSTLFQSTAIE